MSKFTHLSTLFCLSFFACKLGYAEARDRCEVSEGKNYVCYAYTGSAWTEATAEQACTKGGLPFGRTGTFKQYRCDPKPFKGVCTFKSGKEGAYARCKENDNFLSCLVSGGTWSSDAADIETTCFPRAADDKPLVNQSESLEEILEYGEIYGACDRYYADPDNASRRLMLLCGKWMYFYEHFNFPSVPTSIYTFMQKHLPETIGKKSEKLGLFENPYNEHLPVGIAEAPNFPDTNIPTVNWSCSSCHFGQVSDGRFVVGQANVKYQYGKHLIALSLFNYVVFGDAGWVPGDVEYAEEAIEYMQPMREEWLAKPNYLELILKLLPIANVEPPEGLGPDRQRQIITWKDGVQDPVLFPADTDDGVHSPIKIPSTYGIPRPETFVEHGFPADSHIRLGWAGAMDTMLKFAQGFVGLGPDDPANWPEPRLRPLMEYILSLKPPKNLAHLDSVKVDSGAMLFESKGCQSCHNGPNYMGMDVYDFSEIGTDAAHKWQLDADRDGGLPEPNLTPDTPLVLTHKISAPRLAGLWTQDKFLHNGSVDSLEDLFCLDRDRPTILEEPFSDKGHRYTCDGLSRDEKLDLMEFLLSI